MGENNFNECAGSSKINLGDAPLLCKCPNLEARHVFSCTGGDVARWISAKYELGASNKQRAPFNKS